MSKIQTNKIQHTATGAAELTLPTADGSANQFLKTNGSGALSFATASDYFKIQAASSTSAIGALVWQNLDVTTYRTFKIIISAYPVTDAQSLYLRVLDGSTYKTNANTYNWAQTGTNGASAAINIGGQDSFAKVGGNAGNNNYEGWKAEITYVPQVSGEYTHANNFGYSQCNRYSSTNSHRGETFHFRFHQADVTDGIELYAASGQIAAYSYTLYGLKR